MYKKLTSPDVTMVTPDVTMVTAEELQGVELVPADKRWGLLPSQLTAVLETMRTEEQLLKVGFVVSCVLLPNNTHISLVSLFVEDIQLLFLKLTVF